MWFVFGIVAIVSAIMNIAWALTGRDPKWFYSINARGVINEEWSALMDVVPATTTGLTCCCHGASLMIFDRHANLTDIR